MEQIPEAGPPSARRRWLRGLALLVLWVCVVLSTGAFMHYRRSQAFEGTVERLGALLEEHGAEEKAGPDGRAEQVIDWLDQLAELLKDDELDWAALDPHKAAGVEVLMARLSLLVHDGVPRWQARNQSTGALYRSRLHILRHHLGRADQGTSGDRADRITLLLELMRRGGALDIGWAAFSFQFVSRLFVSAPADPSRQRVHELLGSIGKTELSQSFCRSIPGWAASELDEVRGLGPEPLFSNDPSVGWVSRFCGTYYLERTERLEVAIQRLGAAQTSDRDDLLEFLSERKTGWIYCFVGQDTRDELAHAAGSVQQAMQSMKRP